MNNFEERMQARKLREADEYRKTLGDKQPVPEVQEYRVKFDMTILGTSDENAAETLALVQKLLAGFSDLKDVEGEFV